MLFRKESDACSRKVPFDIASFGSVFSKLSNPENILNRASGVIQVTSPLRRVAHHFAERILSL